MGAIKPGTRLRSVVSEAEVVVVRASADDDVVLTCGGAPLVPLDDPTPSGQPVDDGDDAVLLGKRYIDDDTGVELLCTKAGVGALAVDGRALTLKGAKPLPSSD